MSYDNWESDLGFNTCSECKYFSTKYLMCTKYSNGTCFDSIACGSFVSWFSDSPSSSNNTGRNKKSGCFLTSACCQYKGLPDDCYELQTLRTFRDKVLPNMDNGQEIIELYYEIAPHIVTSIEQSDTKNEYLEYIYKTICEVVKMIETHEYERAVNNYLFMVYKLSKATKVI